MAAQEGRVLSRASDYFDSLLDAFHTAEAGEGSHERQYQIGRFGLTLRFAGQQLVPHLTPALAHLASRSRSDTGLTVCLFDSESTRTNIAAFPWPQASEADVRGLVRPVTYVHDDRVQILYEPVTQFTSLLDRQRDLAIVWTPAPSHVPYYECSAPLRSILYWWMRERGWQLLHAAAVGRDGIGVLLVGPGGSGKSTSALSVIGSELSFVGDDYVLVDPQEPSEVYSVYSSGKLTLSELANHPVLAPTFRGQTTDNQEKAILYLNDAFADRIARKLRIVAIVMPRVAGLPASQLTRATPVQCLAAMAPSTILQLRGGGREDLARMGELMRRVPSYRLELGEDRTEVRRVFLELLSDGGRQEGAE